MELVSVQSHFNTSRSFCDGLFGQGNRVGSLKIDDNRTKNNEQFLSYAAAQKKNTNLHSTNSLSTSDLTYLLTNLLDLLLRVRQRQARSHTITEAEGRWLLQVKY